MKARVSQLYKTEAEWLRLPNFKPFPGEIVIFAPDAQHSYPRMKIGDGNTLLINLPFFGITELDDPRRANKVIDAGCVTEYKNK
jgi:hypothetical protein